MKHFFGLTIMLWSFMSLAQNYEYTMIDNEDYKAIKENGYVGCIAHSAEWINDSVTVERHLSDVYYYNELGLTTKEVNYLDENDSLGNKWILTAQYDEQGYILTEQWLWTKDEIDSSTYYYNDDMTLRGFSIWAYEPDDIWLDDSAYFEYFKDSIVEWDKERGRIWATVVMKGDSTHTTLHLFDGFLTYTEYNGEMVRSVDRSGGELVVREYMTEPMKGNREHEYIIKNGEVVSEYIKTYKKGLVIEVIYINHEKKKRVITEYEYFKK